MKTTTESDLLNEAHDAISKVHEALTVLRHRSTTTAQYHIGVAADLIDEARKEIEHAQALTE